MKRFLPDERRRIDLHDLVMNHVNIVVEHTQSMPQHAGGDFVAEADAIIEGCESSVEPLSRLVMVGVQHDTDARFEDLWLQCLQRLLRADRPVEGAFQESLTALRRYPALLFMRAAGVVALEHGQDRLFINLLTRPRWRRQFGNGGDLIAAHALAEYDVLNGDLVNALPRSGTSKWLYPPSHHLRDALRPLFTELLPGKDEYAQSQDDYEYHVGLVQHHATSGYQRAMPGEYIGEWRWDNGVPLAETRFRARAEDAPADWTWFQLLGGEDKMDEVLVSLREHLKSMRRWG